MVQQSQARWSGRLKRRLLCGTTLVAIIGAMVAAGPVQAQPTTAAAPDRHAAATAPGHPSEADAERPDRPAGERFYDVPQRLLNGPHGTVIRQRHLAGPAAFDGARNWLVLHRSVTPQGESVAVSGTVAIPRGPAPRGGWPVISWLHGTTGVADVCAPSRDSAGHPTRDYLQVMHATLQRWVDRGYAVAYTDYQGLGTAGPHSYLIGEAEARAAADMVRAAHQLPGRLSTQWVAYGHSQGGHAAVFAADIANRWTPELQLLGAVGLAPGSQVSGFMQQIRDLPLEGISGFLPLIIRGVETTGVAIDGLLTPEAAALMPHADDRCLAQLSEPDSWGALRTDEVFQPGADFTAFDQAMADNEPGQLAPSVPVFLAQGESDTIVQPSWTQDLTSQLTANGVDVTSETYADADHRGVIAASYDDVTGWVDHLFGR